MDSFDFGPRTNAQYSSFESITWIVTSSKDPPQNTFASEMDAFLNGLKLDSNEKGMPSKDSVEISPNASDELMSTLNVSEDLEMRGGCVISRQSGFSALTGKTSHHKLSRILIIN